MPRHCKKISTEIVHQNPWWHYKHDVYETPSGERGDYYYGENHDSVLAVPVLPDGRVALVLRQRYLREKTSIEFPRGGICADESPAEAVKRELLEESGYQAGDFVKVGAYDALSGLFRDTTHVFVVTDLKQVSAPTSNILENIEIIYRQSTELADMIKRGEIWDGQTLAAWALASDFVGNLNNAGNIAG